MDEIIAINTRISQQYDFDLERSLYKKIRQLTPSEANILLERCLTSPTADSLYLHCLCLRNGAEIPKDEAREVEILQKAVDLGNSRACHQLGYRYCIGRGVPQDKRKADDLYRASGTPHSLWNLGCHCQKTDPETALRYFSRAWAMYPPGRHREDCRKRIATLMTGDRQLEILQRLIKLEQQDELQKNRIAELEARVEAQQTELDYRPGGDGYREAREEYETLARGPPMITGGSDSWDKCEPVLPTPGDTFGGRGDHTVESLPSPRPGTPRDRWCTSSGPPTDGV